MSANSNESKVERLFKPDSNGVSDWVPVGRFQEAGLSWSTNGNQRHGAFWNYRKVKWEARRLKGTRSQITHLRMIGWNEAASNKMSQQIISGIRSQFNHPLLDNISLLPIPKGRMEVDHRYGHKTHPDYVNLYKKENQRLEYFQALLDVNNSIKRQMCVRCVESGERPQHPTKGFVSGDSTLASRFPCSGCYLAEPEKYR